MLGRGVLSRLHTLTQQKTYTLTMYLDIDQNKRSNRKRGYVVQAEALLKDLKGRQGRSQRLDTAADQALELVRSMRPKGKAALVVVHPETELRELHQISVPSAASVFTQAAMVSGWPVGSRLGELPKYTTRAEPALPPGFGAA